MNEKDLEDLVFYLEEYRKDKKDLENGMEELRSMLVRMEESINDWIGVSRDDKKGPDER